jgi:hypothetical protein
MTVEFPISLSTQEAQRAAIDDVNRWRGHCIELFARADDVIRIALAQREDARIPGSLAGRLEVLKKGSPPKLVETLDELKEMVDLRNILAHAVSKVWISDKHAWLWAYRFKPTGSGKSEQLGHWCDADARKFEQKLRKVVQRLSGYLSRESAKSA